MAVVGYARVSSVGQSLEVQLGKLGYCGKLYREKQSGVHLHKGTKSPTRNSALA